MTEVIDLERISSLSNEELFSLMKEYNLNVGPITGTTRSIYEKKLRLHVIGLPKKQQQQQQKENENVKSKEPAVTKSSTVKKAVEKVVYSEVKYDKDTHTRTRNEFVGKLTATDTAGYTSEKSNESPSVLSNISNSKQSQQWSSQRETEQQQQPSVGIRRSVRDEHVSSIPQWSQRDSESQQQQKQRSIEINEPKQQQWSRETEQRQQLSRDSQQRDKRRDDYVCSSSSSSSSGTSRNNNSNVNEETKTTTKDDINVRFVRSDATPHSFNTGRLSNTFSTPQTDKFAMRLNSYGLLKQDGNRSLMSSGIEHKQQRTSIQQKYATAAAADSTTSTSHSERRVSPRTRKSPENVKIFANSIIRDNLPTYNQAEQVKKPSPIRSRQSPENVKIFANSIIRDNVPYTNESKYNNEKTATQTAKTNDLAINWKYLAAVGFITVIAYISMINIEYLFSNDEL